jgi:peptidyl-prolyl cis-trans isomerase A (cyclophilin A)
MTEARLARRSLLGAMGLVIANPLQARAATKPRVTIQTAQGVIVVELETEKAPVTSANFLRYVDAKKYDGGTIYRASRTKGVKGAGSIQGGPSARARRYAPIAHESTRKTGIKHRAGTISMARNAPGSATCDFFICASALPYLDARPGAPGDNQGFAAFGTVVKGMDIVKTILAKPTGGPGYAPGMKGEILLTPVAILSMTRSV